MPTNLWESQQKRAFAQELVDFLLPGSIGWPIGWGTTIAFAELVSSAKPGLSKSSAMLVLEEMRKQQKKTAEDFELIYEELVSNTIAPHQVDDWRFFIPLEMTINADVRQPAEVTLFDNRLSFLPEISVKSQTDKDTSDALEDIGLLQQKTERMIRRIPQVFLSVTSSAANWSRAWKNIEPAFDTLRGLTVLLSHHNSMRLFDDSIRPRGQLPHPTWMIVQMPGGEVEWISFQTDEFYPDHPLELTDSGLAAIKTNAAVFEKKPASNSTVSVLADCLRLYAQAMDAKYPNDSFLAFWQLVEAITHSKSVGGNAKQVVQRIAWHGKRIGLHGSGFKETLRAFSDKRNDIVHRGISAVNDEVVNIIKLVCEIAIGWLFGVHERLPTTNHLECFYQYLERNDAILEATRDSVVYVIESRKRQ